MLALCPCGSGDPYATCCEPLLTGVARPATPEQLMRSRYTAFCERHVDYLIDTHHPTQRAADERQGLQQTMRETEWLSLRVLAAPPAHGDTGVVEFAAFFRSHDTVNQPTNVRPLCAPMGVGPIIPVSNCHRSLLVVTLPAGAAAGKSSSSATGGDVVPGNDGKLAGVW